MMVPDTQSIAKGQALQKAANMLGEYFDDVVILCSWQENGGTMNANSIIGSQYAALGMMHDYLDTDSAITRNTILIDMASGE